jgi:two-component sensor histidine kinase
LGLVQNEAITNSIKYAFPGKQHGNISIILKQPEHEHFVLTISDDGVGIQKEDLDTNKINSFGLTLIQGLCDDIGGQLEIRNDRGTTIQLKFLYHARVEPGEPLLHTSA